ncbi:MAG TPA: 2-oxoacid:acceptor oxidoreductase subunit alpha [Saprospiraceae bacterium]|nr:2-oxoacid:acceptor oxidoreductase subunit alpha [Saprospiraceae bacterium]MBK9743643.1 2-oxoacid:acceptor oxidoreductase subunit alpha [Saprospiraceae bacterium]HMT52858.1 2-oxoacid:acceptor oxidoreductase subunit alpha [Saprospiraceae bacterium]HMT69791.1 2-oxoacid:acceptor oxidoreductase subunit alpha [Saprospiraceae bacterium]HQV66096.1 2-oxoacid:acceptor oxidoreductase subunit alpha [Saprospiraceae bacterium]
MSRVNDFVVRFANVNGTGSASANYLFAKSVFRMGVPVSAKNIFPSNIQGLPTWYEVRVSEKGYLGRKEGIDLMISVNPQSFKKDIASVRSGGYFLYDSTKPLHNEFLREDIHFIGVPLMEICNREFTDPRQKQLFKNIVYVGAVARLLNIDTNIIEGLFAEQFQGKEKLIAPNVKALHLGSDFIKENFSFPLDFYVEARDLVGDSIMIDGNSAAGLGAIYAGATVVSWYPITPSTSLVSSFESYAKKLRKDPLTGKNNFSIVQAEDELAAIGMAIGANWNGARSFTATSGPGLSLMSEFLGLAYYSELPVVLVDVQRSGPSTGMPTRTQQSDFISAAYASHGDTKHVLLIPSTPTECFDMMADAFDYAEKLQTPVIVMSDLDLGMNDHMTPAFKWDDSRKYQRGKVLTAEQLDALPQWGRYRDVDGDGIPYRTLPGTHPTKGSYFTRGSSHDENAAYSEDSPTYVRIMDRLLKKLETAKKMIPAPEVHLGEKKSDVAMLYFGTSMHAAEEALDILKNDGASMDAIRIKSFPFCNEVKEFIENYDRVFVVEQNRDAQMRSLLINELEIDPKKLIKVLNYDGTPITADFILKNVHQHLFQSIN